MKRNEFVQIKGLDIKQLQDKATALKNEIADLILDKNMKKLKDLKMISKKRRERAQILTVIRQKEMLIELEPKLRKNDGNKSVIASEAKQSILEENPNKIATSPAAPRNDKRGGKK